MSGLITVIRGGAKTAPKKAPTFFSRVDEAAKELPRTKGTGKEFMAELKKQPGVKKAELEDRKLSSLESAPKMTKEEFVKKLNEKPAPKIKEDIKSNPTNADLDARAMELIEKEAEEMTDDRIGRWDRSNSYEWLDYKEGAVQYLKSLDYDKYLRQAKRDIEENVGGNFPKFQDWKLPGGENYREILLKLPSNRPSLNNMSRAEYNAAIDAADKAGIQNYQSSHWDEPNVLAHIRVQDRVGPNGEKILHVEEIQSDWHQAGRKKGYGLTELPNKFVAKQDFSSSGNPWGVVDENGDWITSGFHRSKEDAQAEALKRINAQTVPDAPFKKNWHELATKRIMDYAIQNGYDKVAITPGAEQASRYSLSKSIDEINVTSRTHAGTGEVSKSVALDTKDGKSLRFGVSNDGKIDNVNDASLTNFMGKSLDEVIGKDMAKKILEGGTQTISGEGLTVGGEGMKGFYDQILPAYINKEYGKYGSQVNMNSQMVPVPDDEVPIHTFDITPQMREDIQSKGQPLYQATGIGLTGAAAAPSEEKVQISDNPDTMMLELQDRGFAGGGLLKKAAKAIKGTQEVLSAAEREANKAKFLEPSSDKRRFYHSTASDINKFQPGGQSRATFVTPDPKFAEEFALDNFATRPGSDQFLQGTRTMPVHVQVKDPFDYENPEHIQNLYDAIRHRPWLKDEIEGMGDFEHNWHHVEHPDIQHEIRRLGHDSFYSAERGTKNLGVYDPRKIKSAIGNRGTYDVTDPDITKAGGGLLKKAVKGAQAVLPTAEREANLAKMLEKSSVKKRVYHGTESKDDYSKDSKGNDAIKSFAGQSTWVAEEPYTSHGYAGKSGYVMPLHVKLEKPLTINHIDANDEASNIFDIAKGIGVDIGHLKSMSDPEKVWEVINHPYFIDAASNAGFDGISIKEGGRQTHSVFNPGNIKSAIGNRGTYDVTDPDINKALGGLARAKRK